MTGIDKLMCRAAMVMVLAALSTAPAKAQFGGGAGGEDMMTQMAPMLEMMKAKMGKRRFASMMQTMGPMMSKMMDNGGGLSGEFGGGGIESIGGMLGGGGGDFGGGNIMSMMGSSEMMGMIPQLINMGGGRGHRHGRRHRK